MARAIIVALVWMSAAVPCRAEDREVRGRVVDAEGRPVAGATVDHFWSANGSGKRPDGARLDLTRPEELREFWGHLGEMEPRSSSAATTGPDGVFTMKASEIHHAILALDTERERGGLGLIPKEGQPGDVEIRLAPLTRVRARFQGPDPNRPPGWTHAYVLVPEEPTRPLDSLRLAHCGSFASRFEVLLPPGRYTLDAYGQSSAEGDDIDLRAIQATSFEILPGERERDLGMIRLGRDPKTLEKRIERARADGTWGDVTKHYGEPPPPWHAVDARGISPKATWADLRGKWVLVEFWGPSCRVCMAKDIPRLIRFYEKHAADRDRFEILGVCLDFEGEIHSMADFDRVLAPVVEHVWGGKAPSFPIVLDDTFHTWERFGLPGLGIRILVDPEGRLVEGDETTLAEILARDPRNAEAR